MNTLEILEALRNTTSTKEKANILTQFKFDADLEKILKYAYDKVDYTFGVTSRTVMEYDSKEYCELDMFAVLDALNAREVTGHKALALASSFANSAEIEIRDLFLMILDRDLKIGVNAKTLNKVFKNIVPKPN